MSKKQQTRPDISTYKDSDSDEDAAPTIMQSHTELFSNARGLSTKESFYSLPASPQKRRPQAITDSVLPDMLPDLPYDELDVDGYIGDPTEYKRMRNRFLGDNPLLAWTPYIDRFVQELLRLEGRGDAVHQQTCALCRLKLTDPHYRCKDCFDGRLFCSACIVMGHSGLPFHSLEVWNGRYFTGESLKNLGFRFQLGHPIGVSCPCPERSRKDDFVILDMNGIHHLCLDYCNCETAETHFVQLLRAKLFPATVLEPMTAATFSVLKHFQLLSFMSKTSAHEFYLTLARQTENTGIASPPDRYSAFLRIVREWRHVKLLKRMARGHDASGVAGTKEGECAVLCPACPLPGINLPSDWKTASEDKQWLYSLFVGQDANFRLKRLNVSSQEKDPGLNHGYAYVVNEAVFRAYLNEYDNIIGQEDSTCNNHDAIKSANMRGGKGTAASGVGTVECIRHDMKRPLSVGDLQKGERYVNMDYFFMSSMRQNCPQRIIVSYDIACQWSINLRERTALYPPSMTGGFRGAQEIVYAIPKYHIPGHVLLCRGTYSLNFLPHVGRTDGEAPERGWAATNLVANSTKEMGPGSRRDTLDDHFGDYNWKKVSSIGITLLRKVREAVLSREEHVNAFEEFHAALPTPSTAQWLTAVRTWEKDRSKPNPFITTIQAVSEHAIRLQLAQEDANTTEETTVVHHEVSQGLLISQGLELEFQQHRLGCDIKELGQHSTDLQRAKIIERTNALRRKIEAWCEIQILYMPTIAALRAKDDEEGGGELVNAINMKLMLPSYVVNLVRGNRRLFRSEWCLRLAQAQDLLAEIRRDLLLLSQLHRSKDRLVRGQQQLTRSHTLLKRVDNRIKFNADRYRTTYSALSRLAVVLLETQWQSTFRPLTADDVRGLADPENDRITEGRRTISWIWKSGTTDGGSDDMEEALRSEWCRARARAHRWHEECQLLEEEMRRVKAFFEWDNKQWSAHSIQSTIPMRPWDNYIFLEGRISYALQQAEMRQDMRNHLIQIWDDPAVKLLANGPGSKLVI